MADTTLNAIRTKVRRLTRSPSEAQLSTAEIDEYVNTFVLWDFPEHLRLFSLKTTYTFYTQPNIDTYENSLNVNSDLFDFINRFTSFAPPVYIAGFQGLWSQSRDQFYGIYPFTNSIASIGALGDGVTTNFAGTLSSIPVLRNNVTFSSKDANNNGLILHDDGNGLLVSEPLGAGFGTIDYITGAFTLAFGTAPAAGAAINSETVPYQAALPQAVLYYDNKFVVRPVPDQSYPIQMEAYARPTSLLLSGDRPELDQWWQYIAYGAARKVFQDRMDLDSITLIEPEYKMQEALVLRKTIVQQTNQRTSTIYTENVASMYGSGWFYGGGSF